MIILECPICGLRYKAFNNKNPITCYHKSNITPEDKGTRMISLGTVKEESLKIDKKEESLKIDNEREKSAKDWLYALTKEDFIA